MQIVFAPFMRPLSRVSGCSVLLLEKCPIPNLRATGSISVAYCSCVTDPFSRKTTRETPFVQTPNQTIIFPGNLLTWRAAPCWSASRRSAAQMRSFYRLYTPSTSNNFSSERTTFFVCDFLKLCLTQFENFTRLHFCFSVRRGSQTIL